MTREVRKHDFIDALRGYAILGVVMVHSSQFVAPVSAPLLRLMELGARGVQLFYIASALTLCLSWSARRATEAAPIRNFFLRRLFRIAPLFWVAIAGHGLLYGLAARYWAPNGLQWWYLPLTGLFLNGYNPETITSVVPGGWSIAVEMNFYLVLPLLLFWVRSTRDHVLLLFIAFGLAWLSRVGFFWFYRPHYPADQQYLVSQFAFLNFFGQFPVFAIGLLTYCQFKRTDPLPRWLTAGGTLLVIALLVLLPADSAAWRLVSHPYVVSFGFACLTLWFSGVSSGLAVNRLLIELGRLSFSIYLMHFPVIEIAARLGLLPAQRSGDLASVLFYLGVVVVSAVLSELTHRWIERPGIRCGQRLIDWLEARSSKAGNATVVPDGSR